MKQPGKIAALNLGMQNVTMAVFQLSADGGPTLLGFAQSGLIPDPTADASRASQLKVVLSELRSQLSWQSGPCACAIPSQGVFARFVQIPKVEADKVEQVLFFEAQQNVPYPIEEVAWAYQMLPERTEEKLGALIVATKTDALEATVEALNAAKLTPDLIETSSTALYNAFRFNYPDAMGCSLLIDIGARATNLLFIEGDEFFIRTLPIGGNSITAALNKKFDTRSFAEVEEFKRTEGLIPPPGNYDGAKNEDIAEMGKIARTVMTRIHNEITRSITFYRTTQKGSAPMRVFLAGGGVSMPYTLEFFNEKISLPIEYFNPFRRVGTGGSVDPALLGKSAHTMGECVGLALRQSSLECPVSISLKAPSLEKSATDLQRRPFLTAAAAAIVGALALLGLYFQSSAAALARVNAEIQAKAQPLQQINDRIKRASSERDRLLKEGADLAALPILRTGWAEILHELNQRQPEKFLWITKLSPYPAVPGFGQDGEEQRPSSAEEKSEGNESGPAVTALSLEGLYLENDGGPAVVDDFVNRLAESPLFEISEENKGDVVQVRATQTDESWAYEYRLLVPLKRPIPL
jgi:type IV pilus assembly protein PilM